MNLRGRSIFVLLVLLSFGTCPSVFAAGRPESAVNQVNALAKRIPIGIGYDPKAGRFAAIVEYRTGDGRPERNDPHLFGVLKALERLADRMGASTKLEKSFTAQGEETRLVSESEVVLPSLGRLMFTSSLETRKGGTDFDESAHLEIKLVGADGKTTVLPSAQDKERPPVDPLLRGRIIRAFYQMGFMELAYRRAVTTSKEGTFEEHAWLYCLDLPTGAAPKSK